MCIRVHRHTAPLPLQIAISPLRALFLITVTYATKQLTQALQDLTTRTQQSEHESVTEIPAIIPVEHLQFSKEVEQFLEAKQSYSQKTRAVSAGSY